MRGPWSRREFLGTVTAGVGTPLAAPSAAVAFRPRGRSAREAWIDVNVWLGQWPTRRIPGDEPAELVAGLRARGVTEAWAGTFEGMLHKNVDASNARLAEACRQHGRGRLRPFGTVNPAFPDWEEDLRRCVEVHRMPGVRIFPAYHGYPLSDPSVARLLRMASEAGLVVQCVVQMEDERMMHPLLRPPAVDLAAFPEVLAAAPLSLRLVLLNALKAVHPVLLRKLVDTGRVLVEISALEGVAGVENLLHRIPVERVLFGSQAPFLYFEAAALKLQESELAPDQLVAIRSGNARRLLPSAS